MAQFKTREEMLAHLEYLESLDWNAPGVASGMFLEIAKGQGAEVSREDGEEASEQE